MNIEKRRKNKVDDEEYFPDRKDMKIERKTMRS